MVQSGRWGVTPLKEALVISMDFLTVKEVAKELRLHEETVKQMLRAGQMPGYKFGNVWRIDKDEYEAWLKQRRNQYRPSQES